MKVSVTLTNKAFELNLYGIEIFRENSQKKCRRRFELNLYGIEIYSSLFSQRSSKLFELNLYGIEMAQKGDYSFF